MTRMACLLSLTFIGAGMIGCAGHGSAPTTQRSSSLTRPISYGKSTYVIVHGAWGGGWAFREVDRLMSSDGYHVFRPTLTGQGEHYNLSSPDIDLNTHIQDIVNVIEWEDLHDVVLVGHSYGGMVVTGVADRIPDRIKYLIYVDALLPENGESVDDIRDLSRKAPLNTKVENGFIIPTWLKPNTPLPHDVPMSEKTFSQKIELKNQQVARKIPTTFILTVEPKTLPADDMFYPFYQRAKARGWHVETMEGDHNVQWSHPKELVRLLERAPRSK